MNDDLRTYRIRTKIGEDKPTLINIPLKQTYDTFEILSLKIEQSNSYKYYTSNYGVIVGRVIANGGVGIPNAKVSIFIESNETTEDIKKYILYHYSSVQSTNNDGIRYNLLPDEIDEACHQNVGTFPNKRLVLDNKDIMEIFDKYWKYTTVTNEAGDYMLFGVPTGSQQLHVDIDLSDIGIWSQRPRDLVYKGFNINQFDSPNKFKIDKNLNSLSQIYSQDKGLYVYPYWGETTNYGDTIGITRCDIQIDYKFEPTCIFMGCAITDSGSNAIGKNCAGTDNIGNMSDLVSTEGSIHMIRKTFDGKVEEFSIKGNRLIDQDGVWCYQIPMNLDYMVTDEYGNLIPSDNPEKGIPTRTRVRFRFSLDETVNDNSARKRCMYLVPNNQRKDKDLYPNFTDDETYTPDYEFGSNTRDEDFCDMLWNKVYTVKNYIPRIQKTRKITSKRHTGIKLINHHGDNNPMPYNNIGVRLSFTYRLVCVITKIFIKLVGFLNNILTIISAGPCLVKKILDTIIKNLCRSLPVIHVKPLCFLAAPLKMVRRVIDLLILPCIEISSSFCEGNTTHAYTFYPGCGCKGLGNIVKVFNLCNCIWVNQKNKHDKGQRFNVDETDKTSPTNSDAELYNCVETQLAGDNDAVSFNFQNDWINGALYFPMWYRKITPKKKFLFGLFKRKAKDEWCSADHYYNGKVFVFNPCSVKRTAKDSYKSLINGKEIVPKYMTDGGCRNNKKCHESTSETKLNKGIIVSNTTMLGQTAYYYKPLEYDGSLKDIKLLFATDIVLLGSLNDCDIHGIPQFFKSLESSTYNLPPDILFTDNNFIPSFNADGTFRKDVYDQVSTSEMTGSDWGNSNDDICPESGTNGGLFYSIGCSTIELRPKSCINLSRICEYGVSLDETKQIPNLNELENDSTNSTYSTLVPDGFISKDELYNDDERSMFATMNGNQLKTVINPLNGLKEYDFRHLYVDNFDNSLRYTMQKIQSRCPSKYTYKGNYNLEEFSRGYYDFRMGKYNLFYDKGSFSFPRYENSFYFYFGLKAGHTAIEKFNNQFFSECENDTELIPSISIKGKGNSWCNNSVENRTDNDGYISMDIDNVLPCTKIIIKSTTDEGFLFETEDDYVINDALIFIGNNKALKDADYVDYSDKFVSPINNEVLKCLPNGEYEINITDNDGNVMSYYYTLSAPYLSFDVDSDDFKLSDERLIEKYGNRNSIGSNKEGLGNGTRKIGGVIIVSNVINSEDYSQITDFKINITCDNYNCNLTYNNGRITKGFEEGVYYLMNDNNRLIFGVPEGDKNYKLTVTQECNRIESGNSVTEYVTVKNIIPYKLFINGEIDCDVISGDEWKTGFTLNGKDSFSEKFGKIGNGWLHMSNPEYYHFEKLTSYQGIKKEIDGLLDALTNIGVDTTDLKQMNKTCIKGNSIIQFRNKVNGNAAIPDDIKESLLSKCDEIEAIEVNFIEMAKDTFYLNCNMMTKDIALMANTNYLPVTYSLSYREEEMLETSQYDLNVHTLSKDKMTFTEKESGFDDISIPTISTIDNQSYKSDKIISDKICFTKVQNCSFSDKYKYPYFVSVTNSQGETIPDGFAKNNYKQMFSFHIIDKIFKIDGFSWSAIDGIPYYKPSEENKIGKTIQVEGLFAGKIYNGSATYDANDKHITNFISQTIDGDKIEIYTERNNGEDDITVEDKMPTVRTIIGLEGKENNGFIENYIIDNNINRRKQYIPLVNDSVEIELQDTGSCPINYELLGDLVIKLDNDSVNDLIDGKSRLSIDTDNGEEMTYYIYNSKNYPLNYISLNNKLDYKGNNTPWDGNNEFLFSHATANDTLKTISQKTGIYSIDDDGNTIKDENGYTTNGKFGINKNIGTYFVVGCTKNNNRVISPVYDFIRLNGEVIITNTHTKLDDGTKTESKNIGFSININDFNNSYYFKNFSYSMSAILTINDKVIVETSENNIKGHTIIYGQIDDSVYDLFASYANIPISVMGERFIKDKVILTAIDFVGLTHRFRANKLSSEDRYRILFSLSNNPSNMYHHWGDDVNDIVDDIRYWSETEQYPSVKNTPKSILPFERFIGWNTDKNAQNGVSSPHKTEDKTENWYAIFEKKRIIFRVNGYNAKWVDDNQTIEDRMLNIYEDKNGVLCTVYNKKRPVSNDANKEFDKWAVQGNWGSIDEFNTDKIILKDNEIDWNTTYIVYPLFKAKTK